MDDALTEYWTGYYRHVFRESGAWLDYSNERVQMQTFGVAFEAAGPLGGCRCLDVGCGRGRFALALSGLGAAEVVAMDIIAESIHGCRREHPHVRWLAGSAEDEPLLESLGDFDRIFLLEVLEYLDARRTLAALWRR